VSIRQSRRLAHHCDVTVPTCAHTIGPATRYRRSPRLTSSWRAALDIEPAAHLSKAVSEPENGRVAVGSKPTTLPRGGNISNVQFLDFLATPWLRNQRN